MKRVALLADGWERLITYDWIKGIKNYINNCSERIELDHYNCMGNWNDDAVFNQGEYNIFNLPQLEKYDGIILDVNTMKDKRQWNHLMDIVKQSGVPAVNLGHYIDGFYYVGVDNKKAIRLMMQHLREEHDCNSFRFVGGPVDNKENQERVESFLECIREWGLDEDENTVSYGTFEMSAGQEYFCRMIEGGCSLPDAFVCVNDNIAAGLIYEAQKRRYSVPRDFAVTGFDNLDKAICFIPQITTVSHKRELMGETCMKIFEKIWNNESVEVCHYIEPEISYTESCGCPFSIPIDFRAAAQRNIVEKENRRLFEEKRVTLEAKLVGATEFEEIFIDAGEYFEQLDCDGITLVIDERIMSLGNESDFPVLGFDRKHLKVVYGNNVKSFEESEDFDTYWRRIESEENQDVYMFTPFHYRDKTIGFTILKNGKFLYDNPYFYDIQSLINRVIWETYQRKCYIDANRKLDYLYKRDALTGIYNRMAYFEMAETMVETYQADKKSCLIAFFDCDNFKEINDEQGHDAGDEILKKVGRILAKVCDDKGGAFRFGGDEFVVIYPLESNESSTEIIDELSRQFVQEQIDISIGAHMIDWNDNRPLQEFLNMADQCMYDNKKAKQQ